METAEAAELVEYQDAFAFAEAERQIGVLRIGRRGLVLIIVGPFFAPSLVCDDVLLLVHKDNDKVVDDDEGCARMLRQCEGDCAVVAACL